MAKQFSLTRLGCSDYAVSSGGIVMKVEHNAEFRFIAERSRFFAVIFPAADQVAVQKMVRLKKGEQRKANHHCWAFRGRGESGNIMEKSHDDGEVGHPGRVLLELLRHYDFEGGLLVSRVFGGVKLGAGGVSRAFRQAGEGAIEEYKKKAK
jgi:putative IMPACT (imprinted ancient) family translation regulator